MNTTKLYVVTLPSQTARDAGQDLVHNRISLAVLAGTARELKLAAFSLKASGLVTSDCLGDNYLVVTRL